ncbi:MAG TPA: hypothetical protein ENJ95_15240 [Bacteroidetes bacterium]|nr:hypothetical protein [Bacteroidota bacterium]
MRAEQTGSRKEFYPAPSGSAPNCLAPETRPGGKQEFGKGPLQKASAYDEIGNLIANDAEGTSDIE